MTGYGKNLGARPLGPPGYVYGTDFIFLRLPRKQVALLAKHAWKKVCLNLLWPVLTNSLMPARWQHRHDIHFPLSE